MKSERVSRKQVALFVLLIVICKPSLGQRTEVSLWTGSAPGSEGKTTSEVIRVTPEGEHIVSGVNHPSITAYLPSPGAGTGIGVLVIPGGGHSEIWIDHEGYSVADWMSKHGIAAFVLKYRLAKEVGSSYTVEGTELQDTQRALRLLRSKASEWGMDPERIGVIGFSAGGELAALASSRYDSGVTSASDPIERQSSKPAFEGLIYPAIPHDMQLSKETPAAFLACGENDRPAVSEGLPALYLSMKHAGINVELHVFSGVGHGFGIRKTNPSNVEEWPDLFYRWLQTSSFVKK